MDVKYIVIFVILNFCCLLIGFWYGRRSTNKKRDGVFRVDTTNPDKDVFSLELEIPVGLIPEKDKLIFEVVNTSSQEKPLA